MPSYQVRTLRSDDFEALSVLEQEIFGAAGEALLCPHYLRLCCEIFGDTCFLALDGDRPVAYLLCFIKDRRAHCTSLAVHADYQRRRVTGMLIAAFARSILDRVDECWFTVKEDNLAARGLHAFLGARELYRRRDYYGKGDERIVSCIDREGFERVRERYRRLGVIAADGAEPASRAITAEAA